MENVNKITRRYASKLIVLGASSYLLNTPLWTQKALKMNTRLIPSTGEEIPIVGLGTWQTFDVGQSENERNQLKEVLMILKNHGGSVIDSSPMYGRSESVVGELLSELKLEDSMFEATKVWTEGKQAGINQMQTSMSLMRSNPMDLFQIHNLVDWKTHINTLKQWKEEGKVRYIGISHYHKGAYQEMRKIMLNEPIDFIQVNYNLAVRDSEEVILPLAREKGIAVLINRPYEGGALFQKVKSKAFPEWASEFGASTWGQFFLKYILANKAVTCVIPGTSKSKHMLDNVKAGFGNFPDARHLKKMNNIFSG